RQPSWDSSAWARRRPTPNGVSRSRRAGNICPRHGGSRHSRASRSSSSCSASTCSATGCATSWTRGSDGPDETCSGNSEARHGSAGACPSVGGCGGPFLGPPRSMNEELVLVVDGLALSIATDDGPARVLDHVDLRIPRGRIVGVVGESGCGKSTLARAVLGILPRAARVERGRILFGAEDLLRLSQRELTRRVRGKEISFIPQDPYLALNPVFTVGTQLLEIMRWHAGDVDNGHADRRSHRTRLMELLRAVQIPDPDIALDRYPHQFSGGQRQRLLIAGALACRPRLVIADEPTSAL